MEPQEIIPRSYGIPQMRFPLAISYKKGMHVLPSVFIAELLEGLRADGIAVEVQDSTGRYITGTARAKPEIVGDLWRRELHPGEVIFFKYRGPEEFGRYINFMIAIGGALLKFRDVEMNVTDAQVLRLPPRDELMKIVADARRELTNQLEIWR